jgi:hypothetical protein
MKTNRKMIKKISQFTLIASISLIVIVALAFVGIIIK